MWRTLLDVTQTETDIKRAVAEVFELAGWLWVRTHAGTSRGGRMRHAPKDWPDAVAFGPHGRHVVVETKRVGEDLTPGQRAMFARLRKMGHQAEVVWSVEDAARIVAGRGRG